MDYTNERKKAVCMYDKVGDLRADRELFFYENRKRVPSGLVNQISIMLQPHSRCAHCPPLEGRCSKELYYRRKLQSHITGHRSPHKNTVFTGDVVREKKKILYMLYWTGTIHSRENTGGPCKHTFMWSRRTSDQNFNGNLIP